MDRAGLMHPGEVAQSLEISAATLRRWSRRFTDYLSESASGTTEEGKTTHRRYTEADLELLTAVAHLLDDGYTYSQVERRLSAMRQPLSDGEQAGTALSRVPDGMAGTVTPAVALLSDTLHSVADGQQLLIGSQQSVRDLIGVLTQDNFNLKEENSRLRDRMLYLEREMAELRRVEAQRREPLEDRISRLERLMEDSAAGLDEPAEDRLGCLSRFLGLEIP